MKAKKGEEVEDLDAVLPQGALDTLRQAFWSRHHLSWPAEVEPADQLVSRVYGEVKRKMLQLKCVWSVRSQTHQMRTQRKKEQLKVEDDYQNTAYMQ